MNEEARSFFAQVINCYYLFFIYSKNQKQFQLFLHLFLNPKYLRLLGLVCFVYHRRLRLFISIQYYRNQILFVSFILV